MRWQVVYLWRGERHVFLSTHRSASDALTVVRAMQRDGWQCWTERVR